MATPSVATVPVKSAWLAKINWVQAGGLVVSAATLVANALPPDKQVLAIAGIQGATAVATWIMRTWFNGTVTPASIAK